MAEGTCVVWLATAWKGHAESEPIGNHWDNQKGLAQSPPASRKERMTLAQFAIARTAGQLMDTADRRTLTKKETRLLDLLLENVERYERMEMESEER